MRNTGIIETQRLILRQETLDDVPVLYRELGCRPEITKYTGWNPYAMPEMARAKVEHDIEDDDSYSWIITKDGETIGAFGAYDIKPEENSIEIGCSIFVEYWGNGYATEAIEGVTEYLREQGFAKVSAWAQVGNVGSWRALEKNGYRLESLENGEIKVYVKEF